MTTLEKLAALGFAGRTADAVALTIDQKMSRRAAAKQIGVDAAAVTRLLNKLTVTTTCKCCGQAIKEIKL